MSPIHGRKIQRLREKKGLSVRGLAREAGMRHPTLLAIEKGTARRVTVEMLESLARVLDVDVSEILTGRNR